MVDEDDVAKFNSDICLLSSNELRCIVELTDGEYCYPMGYIASNLRLPYSYVRRAIRVAYAMGYTERGYLKREDSDQLCGRGYWLTKLGLSFKQYVLLYKQELFSNDYIRYHSS